MEDRRAGQASAPGAGERAAAPAASPRASSSCLRPVRALEVIAHGAPGALRVARADGEVDRPVLVGRFLQVVRAADRLLALLAELLGHHVDQRREDGIPAGRRDGAVELDVVAEERLRILQRGEHAGRFLADRDEVVGGGVLGGHPRDRHLQHEAGLEHLVAREAVQRRLEPQRVGAEHRGPAGDERAGTRADLDDPHHGERSQTGAQARAAHAQLARQLTLGREAVAGPQFAPVEHSPNVRHDMLRGIRSPVLRHRHDPVLATSSVRPIGTEYGGISTTQDPGCQAR